MIKSRFIKTLKIIILMIIFIAIPKASYAMSDEAPVVDSVILSIYEKNAIQVNWSSKNDGTGYFVQLYNSTLGKLNRFGNYVEEYTYQNVDVDKNYRVAIRVCEKVGNSSSCGEWSDVVVSPKLGDNVYENDTKNHAEQLTSEEEAAAEEILRKEQEQYEKELLAEQLKAEAEEAEQQLAYEKMLEAEQAEQEAAKLAAELAEAEQNARNIAANVDAQNEKEEQDNYEKAQQELIQKQEQESQAKIEQAIQADEVTTKELIKQTNEEHENKAKADADSAALENVNDPDKPLINISLNKVSGFLKIGETEKLSVIYSPSNTTDAKNVSWESNNPSVATVSDGVVTALAPGSAVITATSEVNPSIKSSYNVIVKMPLKSISFNKFYGILNKGSGEQLTITYSPANTSDTKSVDWSSSNPSVATVDSSGLVTGISPGQAVITATSKANSSIKTNYTVEVKSPLLGITMNKSTLNLISGNAEKLVVTYNPTDTTDNKGLKWSSSNTSVATVDSSGLVTGISSGEAVITATSVADSSKTVDCVVKVESPLSKISLNRTSGTLKKGGTAQLKVIFNPSSISNKSVDWSSSNKSIATVSAKGQVKGVAPGKAVITATSEADSSLTASYSVTVSPNYVYIKYNMNGGSLSSSHGSSYSASNGIIKCSGSDRCLTLAENKSLSSTGLHNYNNPSGINIKKKGYTIRKGAEWNTKADGSGTSFSQSKAYTAKQLCSTVKSGNCTITLYANWKKYEIALIGNSKTHRSGSNACGSRQSVADKFKEMLKDGGYKANVTTINKGGSNLIYKTKNSPYRNEIHKYYDIVVLQEDMDYAQSDSIKTYKNGALATKELLTNSNAVIYLRTGWPDKYTFNKKGEKVNSFKGNLEKLNSNTDIVSSVIGASVIRDGNAFKEAKSKEIPIYSKDSSSSKSCKDVKHGDVRGVYLAAACIYESIFNEDARELKYDAGIKSGQVKQLRNIAHNQCN